jgi:ubiquitin carboxyl-terminal hydrolase 8
MNNIGLANLGNTCYLNACVQIFKNVYELNDIINKKIEFSQYNKNIPDKNILIEWNKLEMELNDNKNCKKYISPINFVKCIQDVSKIKNYSLFTGFSQNDMPEFLQLFIECIHNSLSRPVNMLINGTPLTYKDVTANKCYLMLKTIYSTEYSEVYDIFNGIYISEIISLNTKQQCSITPATFTILDLPIFYENIVATTLYDCFDFFIKPEILNGENAWFNEKTNVKEDIIKQNSFWNLPQILVITLNRFSIDGTRKINTLINIPIEQLDLSKYISGYDVNIYKYELFGICNHMGNVNGGHYNAFVKNRVNQWILYDDTNTTIVDNINSIISPSTYCLFYRKKK